VYDFWSTSPCFIIPFLDYFLTMPLDSLLPSDIILAAQEKKTLKHIKQ